MTGNSKLPVFTAVLDREVLVSLENFFDISFLWCLPGRQGRIKGILIAGLAIQWQLPDTKE
jgi:hypothetical protein